MSLSRLRNKLEKLFFLNKIIGDCGEENLDALYVLEDEIKELERVYYEVKDILEYSI